MVDILLEKLSIVALTVFSASVIGLVAFQALQWSAGRNIAGRLPAWLVTILRFVRHSNDNATPDSR